MTRFSLDMEAVHCRQDSGSLDYRTNSNPAFAIHGHWNRLQGDQPATTWAGHWLQSGLNVNAISAWLEHSNPTVTLNIYLVLAPDTLGDISEVP